jgi:hypothetical protein
MIYLDLASCGSIVSKKHIPIKRSKLPKKIVAPHAPADFYKSIFMRKNRDSYSLRVRHITDRTFILERALGTNDPEKANEYAAVIFASLPLEDLYHRFWGCSR